ncbi:MAG: hypothetical protein NTY19_50610 [Planctomycetota bacterium]|nr:hypothetical protein [Planctomycetota bacterium]
MTVQDHWRDAVRRIADRNTQVAARVLAERDRVCRAVRNPADTSQGSEDFSAEIMQEIKNLHPTADLALLTDLVCELIWRKLRRQWSGDGVDPFLGVTDLMFHLTARVPHLYGTGNDPVAVTAFRQGLTNGYAIGDLRAWLCKSRRLYSQRHLDDSLLECEISDLLMRHPRSASEHDRSFAEALPRGLPQRVLAWSYILACQLVAGSCDCPQCFVTPETQLRGYGRAEYRCRKSHFLVRANLARHFGCGRDELDFVERAITGGCTAYQARGFAQSMLCNIFETPGLRKLRLARYSGEQQRSAYVLVEGDRHCPFTTSDDDEQSGIEDMAAPLVVEYLCFGCEDCGSFIGTKKTRTTCGKESHAWSVGKLPATEDLEGDFCIVDFNTCPAGHIWPTGAVPICPVDGLVALAVNRRVEVFFPTEREFDDVAWSSAWK